MKISLYIYSFLVLFTLSGCLPGRGMPVQVSTSGTKPITFKERTLQDSTVFRQRDSNHTERKFPTLKLKGKALSKDASLFSGIPIVNGITTDMLPSLNAIPVLRDIKKLLPKGSKVSKTRVKKKIKNLRAESYSGGTVSDGLDIGMVRLGQSSRYTRLIFDSYKWEGNEVLPTEKVNHSGTYIFTHEPAKNRITAIIDGYRGFSALVGDQSELYRGNPTVSTIHLDEYLDDSGFKFVIELKRDVKVYVYELHNPGRIIVDLIPL